MDLWRRFFRGYQAITSNFGFHLERFILFYLLLGGFERREYPYEIRTFRPSNFVDNKNVSASSLLDEAVTGVAVRFPPDFAAFSAPASAVGGCKVVHSLLGGGYIGESGV